MDEKKSPPPMKPLTNQEFDIELSGLTFCAEVDDRYRARITSSAHKIDIWLESKRTKAQCQCTILDIKDHSPQEVELPSEVIISALRTALEKNASSSIGEGDPTVDLVRSDESGSVLELTIHLLPSLKPVYKFPMVPIALEKVDILEAKIRELQEEMMELRTIVGSKKTVYLSLRAIGVNLESLAPGATLPADRVITWCKASALDSNYFSLSSCRTKVTVQKSGLYHIYVRAPAGYGGAKLSLLVNSKETERSFAGGVKTWILSLQLSAVIKLGSNAELSVGTTLSSGDPSCGFFDTDRNTAFTILLLEEGDFQEADTTESTSSPPLSEPDACMPRRREKSAKKKQ
jgi:hypothetical protein